MSPPSTDSIWHWITGSGALGALVVATKAAFVGGQYVKEIATLRESVQRLENSVVQLNENILSVALALKGK